MNQHANSRDLQRRHRLLAAWCAALVFAMVGAAYAAVPLYRMFCQVTGFDGTPRIATKAPATVLDKTVTIRFDANVAPGTTLALRARADHHAGQDRREHAGLLPRHQHLRPPVKGTATYNVFPEIAAVFFNKLQCFCFTEQVLEPGQSVEFPVSFFVDPQIVNDKDARNVTHITLSYTFHIRARAKPGGVAGEGRRQVGLRIRDQLPPRRGTQEQDMAERTPSTTTITW